METRHRLYKTASVYATYSPDYSEKIITKHWILQSQIHGGLIATKLTTNVFKSNGQFADGN